MKRISQTHSQSALADYSFSSKSASCFTVFHHNYKYLIFPRSILLLTYLFSYHYTDDFRVFGVLGSLAHLPFAPQSDFVLRPHRTYYCLLFIDIFASKSQSCLFSAEEADLVNRITSSSKEPALEDSGPTITPVLVGLYSTLSRRLSISILGVASRLLQSSTGVLSLT